MSIYQIRNLKKPTVGNNIAALNGPFGIVTQLSTDNYTNVVPKKVKKVTVEEQSSFQDKAANYVVEQVLSDSMSKSAKSKSMYPSFYRNITSNQQSRKTTLHQRSISNRSHTNS